MRSEVYQACMELKQAIVSPCKLCGGVGYFDQENPIELNPCRCMLSLRYLSALVEARIPRDYWALSLDDLTEVDSDYITFVEWYLERLPKAANQGKGILFLGSNGTGKTSMQCAIGKEAVVQGYSVRYFTAQQYIEASKGNNDLAEDLESAKFLLLDEIDKVYMKSGSNYVQKTLEEFLRRRISDGAVVIACTNYAQKEFTSVFGSSTTSMLQRHLKFVGIEGEDYSERLQEKWTADMEDSAVDYFDDRIMSMARRLWDREQEEYASVWEKPND